LDPGNLEAAYHIALHNLNNGVDITPSIVESCPNGDPEFCKFVETHLVDPVASEGPFAGFRHVALCGVSYCGSTLIDRLLAGLPGVASIGESHWLRTIFLRGKPPGPIDFLHPQAHGIPQCSVCGSSCQYLTMNFRADLAMDRTNWYFKIAERLNTKILVSADKNPPKLVENDPLLRMDCIVLFKSPESAWQSHRDKLPKTALDTEEKLFDQMDKYMRVWERTYRTFLKDFAPKGQMIFLFFDEFTTDPHTSIEKLCTALGLSYDSSLQEHTTPGHAIGGRSTTMRLLRESDYRTEIILLRPARLSESEAELIQTNSAVQIVFKEMLAKYELVFH
jgi:hypothetical protein